MVMTLSRDNDTDVLTDSGSFPACICHMYEGTIWTWHGDAGDQRLHVVLFFPSPSTHSSDTRGHAAFLPLPVHQLQPLNAHQASYTYGLMIMTRQPPAPPPSHPLTLLSITQIRLQPKPTRKAHTTESILGTVLLKASKPLMCSWSHQIQNVKAS